MVPGDSANHRHIWLSLRYVKNKQRSAEHSSAHAATSMLPFVVPAVPLCRLLGCFSYPSSPVGQLLAVAVEVLMVVLVAVMDVVTTNVFVVVDVAVAIDVVETVEL
jgi:hypothetical protein